MATHMDGTPIAVGQLVADGVSVPLDNAMGNPIGMLTVPQ